MSKEVIVSSILNATVDSRVNNGESIAPAMVTRVKSDDRNDVRVNLRVFLDTGADLRYQNIPVVDSQPKEIAKEYPEKVAFWPGS